MHWNWQNGKRRGGIKRTASQQRCVGKIEISTNVCNICKLMVLVLHFINYSIVHGVCMCEYYCCRCCRWIENSRDAYYHRFFLQKHRLCIKVIKFNDVESWSGILYIYAYSNIESVCVCAMCQQFLSIQIHSTHSKCVNPFPCAPFHRFVVKWDKM